MTSGVTKRPPFTPRYWLSWLAVGAMWLLGKSPRKLGLALSIPMGWVLLRLMKERRKIAQRNLERCFPDWTPSRLNELLEEHFHSLGRMVFELAWSWSASTSRIQQMGQVKGVENARNAIAKGKGVLAITHHVTCLEMGGRLAAFEIPDLKGVYRPLKNPVIEWYQNRSRAQYSGGVISKRDMRSFIRFLRNGGVLWYAPDQDFGARRSVFAPFFGIETATLEATGRLIEMTGCEVMPMFPVFDSKTGKYTVTMYPAMKKIPDENIVQTLTRINAMIEEQIRQAPDQYWWIHRRFKTRPEGEPPFYD